MRRQLHKYKMQKGVSVIEHFLKINELCLSMQATGHEVLQDEQFVIYLGSMSAEYD